MAGPADYGPDVSRTIDARPSVVRFLASIVTSTTTTMALAKYSSMKSSNMDRDEERSSQCAAVVTSVHYAGKDTLTTSYQPSHVRLRRAVTY